MSEQRAGWWRRLLRRLTTPALTCSGEMVTLGGATGMEQDVLEHWGKPCPVHDADAARMRDALLKLKQWDMLTLDAEGHGAVTADAPWAHEVIDKALDG